jgi:cephalosporin-C deacetylase
MSAFDDYWADVDRDLERFPARPVLTPAPHRSTGPFTCYDVRLSGIGGHRIFGFLSVPDGDGPFPAVLEVPRYGSVNQPPHYRERLRYVVFALMHRGQRLADSPFRAQYPGLFTLGIESPATYVYRAIVADCLRGAEFLFSRPEVDPARVGVTGDDLAVLTAARRPWFAAVRTTGPVEAPFELDDHLRAYPDSAAPSTLTYFDGAAHERGITAPVLRVGRDYDLTHEDAADDTALDAWLAERLGVPAMTKFDAR